MSNRDHNTGVPDTVTSIPLADPHAIAAEASIGELVRDATTQVSTLVRAEVEAGRGSWPEDLQQAIPVGTSNSGLYRPPV